MRFFPVMMLVLGASPQCLDSCEGSAFRTSIGFCRTPCRATMSRSSSTWDTSMEGTWWGEGFVLRSWGWRPDKKSPGIWAEPCGACPRGEWDTKDMRQVDRHVSTAEDIVGMLSGDFNHRQAQRYNSAFRSHGLEQTWRMMTTRADNRYSVDALYGGMKQLIGHE